MFKWKSLLITIITGLLLTSNPASARFYSVDPVGFQEGNTISFNRYGYANNNPYGFTDPNGENPRSLSGPPIMKNVIEMGGGGYGTGGVANFSFKGYLSSFNKGSGVAVKPLSSAISKGLTRRSKNSKNIAFKENSTSKNIEKNFMGKQSRQQRLKDLVTDGKVSSADRGWIKQEMNEVARKKKGHLRNPPGKDLAHERGRENAKGYGYEHAHLQNRKDHRSQHKLDNFGKSNKDRDTIDNTKGD